MSAEASPDLFNDLQSARDYVDQVRHLYRDEEGEYRGRRTPEQQLIAEVTSEEAKLIVDGVMLGLLALSGTTAPDDFDNLSFAGFTWSDFRSEFSRLLVGFGVLTNRLERDKSIDIAYADLHGPDRAKVASVIFTDFLKHNALRFGVDTAGLQGVKTHRIHNREGGMTEKVEIVDRDKAYSDKEIARNMRTREYTSGVAAHSAGKMSPEEAIALRREFPEMDADDFYRVISFYTDAREELESRE